MFLDELQEKISGIFRGYVGKPITKARLEEVSRKIEKVIDEIAITKEPDWCAYKRIKKHPRKRMAKRAAQKRYRVKTIKGGVYYAVRDKSVAISDYRLPHTVSVLIELPRELIREIEESENSEMR